MESGNKGSGNQAASSGNSTAGNSFFFFSRSCKFLRDWNNESSRRRSSDFKSRV
ncbi:hypothetical protein LINPERHAP1_LOCUS4001 [Linum perenne]